MPVTVPGKYLAWEYLIFAEQMNEQTEGQHGNIQEAPAWETEDKGEGTP